MPEHDRRPERVLGAAGGPRPLPGPLRRRLEEALLSGAVAGPPIEGLTTAGQAEVRSVQGAPAGLRVAPPTAATEAVAAEAVAAEAAATEVAVPGDARAVPPELRQRLEASLARRRRGISHPRRWLLVLGTAAAVATVVGLLGQGNGTGAGGTVHGHVAVGAPSVSAGALYRAGPGAPTRHDAPVHKSATEPRAQAPGTAQPPAAAGTARAGTGTGSHRSGATAGAGTKATGPQAASKAATAAPSAAGPTGAALAVRVVPAGGPAAGTNTVLVEGSALGQVRTVLFGGAPAPSIRHVSAFRLAVVVPPHAPGTVTVRIVPGSARGTSSAALRYSYR